jgi:hypothetical protein
VKQRILTTMGLLVCSIALSGCIRVSGTLPASVLPAPTPAPAVADTKPVTHGIVGEKLTHGAWTVTVEASQRTADKLGGVKPPEGSEFLSVDVGFENKGTDALEVRPEDFQLLDSRGASMPMAKMRKPAFNASSMRPLQARFGTSTVFVFTVPTGSGHYALAFSPDGVGKGTRLEWQVP